MIPEKYFYRNKIISTIGASGIFHFCRKKQNFIYVKSVRLENINIVQLTDFAIDYGIIFYITSKIVVTVPKTKLWFVNVRPEHILYMYNYLHTLFYHFI